jgi:hypothetical protein
MENKKCLNKQCFCDGSCKKPPISLSDGNKDIVSEHFELQSKREEILKMPMNSLSKMALDSLGKSELEMRLEKRYEGFTLSQFLDHCAKN